MENKRVAILNKENYWTNFFFFLPLSYMFILSYLTYWNLTSNTDIFGYYAYLEFFASWRSLKPIFLALLFIKIGFFSGYSKKQLTAIGLAIIVTFFLCNKFHPNYFLLYALTSCFAAKNVSYRSIAKNYFILSLCTLFLTFFFLAYGLIEDNVIQRGEYLRHSFGLVHPNSFGMWSLLIIIYFIQYKQNNLEDIHFVIFAIQSLVVYGLTNSRASFVLSLLVIVLSFLLTHINSATANNIATLLLIIALSFAAIWFILCYFYNYQSTWIISLDLKLSGRIYFSHKALTDFPPNIFGNNVIFTYPVDPLFTYTLVIYGYFGLITFLSMYYIGAIRAYKKHLSFIMIVFFAFQMYNTQENVFLYHLFDLTLYTATCDLDFSS